MTKIELDKKNCINCKKCEEICSRNIFRTKNGKIEVNKEKQGACLACLACVAVCDNDCIKIKDLSTERLP